MVRFRHVAPAVLVVLSIAAVEGCRKKPEPAPVPAAPQPNADSLRLAEQRRIQDSIDAANRAAADAARRAREEADRQAAAAAAAETATLRAVLISPIHFAFDKADLDDQARAGLDAKIPVLLANPGVRLRIAGNTDERGSTEYNLALGQRRAEMAKRYLSERGVGDDRVETASFGEERPVAQGNDEAAWSQNRRDEFEITAGGDRLVRSRAGAQ